MRYLPEFFPEKVLALEPLPVCTVQGNLVSVQSTALTCCWAVFLPRLHPEAIGPGGSHVMDLLYTGVRGRGSAGRVLV